MCLYQCEFCRCLSTECVCDRCHRIRCEEFEDKEVESSQERYYLDELTARAELELQLNNPL